MLTLTVAPNMPIRIGTDSLRIVSAARAGGESQSVTVRARAARTAVRQTRIIWRPTGPVTVVSVLGAKKLSVTLFLRVIAGSLLQPSPMTLGLAPDDQSLEQCPSVGLEHKRILTSLICIGTTHGVCFGLGID
jgi:hypothetical protein